MILLLIVVVLLLLLLGLWGYNRGRWRRWGSPGPASRRPVRPCPANTHVAAPDWGRGWGHPRSPVPSGASRETASGSRRLRASPPPRRLP